jgi:hypothetical protein
MAIGVCMQVADSRVALLLSRVPRLISPALAYTKGSELPVTVCPHPAYPDNSSHQTRDTLLVELLGRCVLEYYALVGDRDRKAKELKRLIGRFTTFVEGLTKGNRPIVWGDSKTGWRLVTEAEKRDLQAATKTEE